MAHTSQTGVGIGWKSMRTYSTSQKDKRASSIRLLTTIYRSSEEVWALAMCSDVHNHHSRGDRARAAALAMVLLSSFCPRRAFPPFRPVGGADGNILADLVGRLLEAYGHSDDGEACIARAVKSALEPSGVKVRHLPPTPELGWQSTASG